MEYSIFCAKFDSKWGFEIDENQCEQMLFLWFKI